MLYTEQLRQLFLKNCSWSTEHTIKAHVIKSKPNPLHSNEKKKEDEKFDENEWGRSYKGIVFHMNLH